MSRDEKQQLVERVSHAITFARERKFVAVPIDIDDAAALLEIAQRDDQGARVAQ
jgi:hypothetical protein